MGDREARLRALLKELEDAPPSDVTLRPLEVQRATLEDGMRELAKVLDPELAPHGLKVTAAEDSARGGYVVGLQEALDDGGFVCTADPGLAAAELEPALLEMFLQVFATMACVVVRNKSKAESAREQVENGLRMLSWSLGNVTAGDAGLGSRSQANSAPVPFSKDGSQLAVSDSDSDSISGSQDSDTQSDSADEESESMGYEAVAQLSSRSTSTESSSIVSVSGLEFSHPPLEEVSSDSEQHIIGKGGPSTGGPATPDPVVDHQVQPAALSFSGLSDTSHPPLEKVSSDTTGAPATPGPANDSANASHAGLLSRPPLEEVSAQPTSYGPSGAYTDDEGVKGFAIGNPSGQATGSSDSDFHPQVPASQASLGSHPQLEEESEPDMRSSSGDLVRTTTLATGGPQSPSVKGPPKENDNNRDEESTAHGYGLGGPIVRDGDTTKEEAIGGPTSSPAAAENNSLARLSSESPLDKENVVPINVISRVTPYMLPTAEGKGEHLGNTNPSVGGPLEDDGANEQDFTNLAAEGDVKDEVVSPQNVNLLSPNNPLPTARMPGNPATYGMHSQGTNTSSSLEVRPSSAIDNGLGKVSVRLGPMPNALDSEPTGIKQYGDGSYGIGEQNQETATDRGGVNVRARANGQSSPRSRRSSPITPSKNNFLADTNQVSQVPANPRAPANNQGVDNSDSEPEEVSVPENNKTAHVYQPLTRNPNPTTNGPPGSSASASPGPPVPRIGFR